MYCAADRRNAMPVRELEVREMAPAVCCVPLATSGLSDEDAAVTAGVFKALGDPARVRIVNRLATATAAVCVCDLVAEVGLSQATVSFHLKKLVTAGILEREQRGTWAYYSVRRDALRRLSTVFRMKEGVR
jgi:ArsR family transcriptional regulator, arsenate/arsenite/antimonite-responsive transcriptional repressor